MFTIENMTCAQFCQFTPRTIWWPWVWMGLDPTPPPIHLIVQYIAERCGRFLAYVGAALPAWTLNRNNFSNIYWWITKVWSQLDHCNLVSINWIISDWSAAFPITEKSLKFLKVGNSTYIEYFSVRFSDFQELDWPLINYQLSDLSKLIRNNLVENIYYIPYISSLKIVKKNDCNESGVPAHI